MSLSLKNLEKQFHRIAQLDHASMFLSWDQMVMMPNAGMTPRSEALAEIASMRHELLTADAMGDWLDEATEELTVGSIDARQSTHIREMRRTWQQSMAMPADLVHAKVIGVLPFHLFHQYHLNAS